MNTPTAAATRPAARPTPDRPDNRPTGAACVIGGARGIGAACSHALSRLGWHIYVADVAAADGAATAAAIVEDGGSAEAMACDATDAEALASVAATAEDRGIPLVSLVNVIGGARLGPVLESSEAEWRDSLRFNLTSVWSACRAFLPLLTAAAPATIVNFSSGMAFRPAPDRAPYSAAKAAVAALTRSLAVELGPRGVRVNAVAPGPIATDRSIRDNPASLLERIVANTPLGRIGAPGEVADTVAFLAGSSSSYITGQVLQVNGGAAIG